MMKIDDPQATQARAMLAPRLTVLGLFEDAIDANHALADLRESPAPPEAVSLLVRENGVDDPDGEHHASDVATALSEAALDQAGPWLLHLVSLILPDEGAFLVAGPIGAVLADSDSVSRWNEPAPAGTAARHPAEEKPRPIVATLVRFGYGEDEADYLTLRVIAGSVLIGVTTANSGQAGKARRFFADRGAVHIGTNWTGHDTAAHAERLVHAPAGAASDEKVVVFDSVSLLVGLCGHDNPAIASACGGAPVVDRHGDETGTIEDLLAEVGSGGLDGPDTVRIRYVIIGFGGLLGVGKSFVAIPAEHVALDRDPIALDADRQTVHGAPQYDQNKPFSRHEEELVRGHFGCPRYWL